MAIFAGATALMALAPQVRADSPTDALINKLEQKGILTTDEAGELRTESQQDFGSSFTNNFDKAFGDKMGMPSWVTGYKFGGDFRGRFEDFTGDNNAFTDRIRWRYRLRFGVAVSMTDGLEAGFRLGSGDPAPGSGYGGNPLSNNSTFQDDFSKKSLYVDTAYGRWTPLNGGDWFLSTTIGKMDNPFQLTPMVFDPDLTPEGAALQSTYKFNDAHSVSFNGAAFVLDEEKTSSLDPFLYGAQLIWNANWTPKLSSSLGVAFFDIVNRESLTTANVPYVNQGNTRKPFVPPTPPGAATLYVLVNNYNPIIADASVTYKLDTFPFYAGVFPVRLAAEFMDNPGANTDNKGYWAGITFGKAGTKHTWDLIYRYEYLEADAWYDQMVDDDNGAFWPGDLPSSNSSFGYFGGTNVKGHLVKFDYSLTDSLMFTATCYVNSLINLNGVTPDVNVPDSHTSATIHFMADLMWKF